MDKSATAAARKVNYLHNIKLIKTHVCPSVLVLKPFDRMGRQRVTNDGELYSETEHLMQLVFLYLHTA